jgi:hypothetical protein
MKRGYEDLDIETLQRLYAAQEKELETAVLSGKAWELVSLKRKILTELSILLHEKLQQQANATPAEAMLRKGGNRLEEQ